MRNQAPARAFASPKAASAGLSDAQPLHLPPSKLQHWALQSGTLSPLRQPLTHRLCDLIQQSPEIG